jgi:molybdenum cofactor guanylyltransferase
MMNLSHNTGIVIAGGKSSRMGRPKAFLPFGNKTLLQNAIDTISPLCSQIILSYNDPEYSAAGYCVVADEKPGCGPLMGLYSAMKHAENAQCIVIPCDCPFVPAALYSHLLQFSGFDAVVPRTGDVYFEPLVAVYNQSALVGLEKAIDAGDYKLQNLRKYLNICEVVIEPSMAFYSPKLFSNVNTPDDYKRI